MAENARRLPWPWVAGLGFGLYFGLGLAYFETFAGSRLPGWAMYGLCAILFAGASTWLAHRVAALRRIGPISPRTYLLVVGALAITGGGAFLVGGLSSDEGLGISLLGQTFIHLGLVGLLPVIGALILSSPQAPPSTQAPSPAPEPSTAEAPAVPSPTLLRLAAQPGDPAWELHPDDLLLVEAADNYCKFHHLHAGQRKVKLLRLTLKEAADLLTAYPQFQRCHRSFLVNARHVQEVQGQSQNYRLKLHQVDEPVPVSRSFDVRQLQPGKP